MIAGPSTGDAASHRWKAQEISFNTSLNEELLKRKQLTNFTLEECFNFLTSLGLGHLRWAFEKNDVDGPLLSALAHRHFGAVMLESMGFSVSEQEVLVSGIKNYHHV